MVSNQCQYGSFGNYAYVTLISSCVVQVKHADSSGLVTAQICKSLISRLAPESSLQYLVLLICCNVLNGLRVYTVYVR